jgi:hypothetical protein
MALPQDQDGIKKGPGRPKGAANKLTVDIRAMIHAALDKAGGEEYLVMQAQMNPTAFLTLLGKIIPTQVQGGLAITNQDGSPLEVKLSTVYVSVEKK